MESRTNRQILLAQRPDGKIQPEHFRVETSEITEPPADHVVLRVIIAQVPPAARAMMTSTTGFEQTKVGDAILSPVVGEVVATSPGGPALGSIGTCFALWEEYAIVPAAQVVPILPGHPLVHSLGLLGLNGLTAYFGMTRIANVEEGETVVVSAAAGGVGHIAGQIARTAGARVIGITGSNEKNRKLEAEYGFAHTVNHRSATFVDDLRDACGETGADVFFDNVGGTVLDAMLPLMGHHGRIVCCGAAAQYDDKEDAVLQPGPRGIPQHLFNKALRMEGIFTPDYVSEWAEGARQLAAWLDEGTIEAATHIWNGLDSAPEALVAVLSGENFGQALVRISPDPS